MAPGLIFLENEADRLAGIHMLESDPGGNQELETGLPMPFNRRRVVLGQSLPHSPVTRGDWERQGPTSFQEREAVGPREPDMCLGSVTCSPWELGQTASPLAPPSVPTRLALRIKEVSELTSLTALAVNKNTDVTKDSDRSENHSSALC